MRSISNGVNMTHNELIPVELDDLASYYCGAESDRAKRAHIAIVELRRLRSCIVAWYYDRHEVDPLAHEAMRIINLQNE